jgi:F-type H+-transporting ATPase subunit a
MACRHFGNILSGTVISALIYGALTAATHALMGALSSSIVVGIIFVVAGAAVAFIAKKKKKTLFFVLGIIVGLLGLFSFAYSLGGFFGDIPYMAIGIPAVTGAYFDWFGGCIQAFIFRTLTTLFIKQAAGD